jgi:hypothetical protein
MRQYSKAIVAVLGAISSISGWSWMDNQAVGAISTILTTLLVYLVPNSNN